MFYLRKLIIETSIETGRLLPESISEITVIVLYFFLGFPNIGFALSVGFPFFLVLLLYFLWKYCILSFEFAS